MMTNAALAKQLLTQPAHSLNTSGLTDLLSFYTGLKDTCLSDNNISVSDTTLDDVGDVIDRNLRFRFPVIITYGSTVDIITGKDAGGYRYLSNHAPSGNINVIDTYAYLLQIANGTAIKNNISDNTSFYNEIRISKPAFYTINDIAVSKIAGSGNYSLSGNSGEEEYVVSNIADNDEYLISLKTTYYGAVPNIYNSSGYYIVKKYLDLANNSSSEWYYPYLFKATNLGIISGDINENGEVYFKPDDSLTRAALIKMAIEATDIPNVDQIESADWAQEYITYFKDLSKTDAVGNKYTNQPSSFTDGSINGFYYTDAVSREETAYMIWKIFSSAFGGAGSNPSGLYEYSLNESTSQNTQWKSGTYFTDDNRVKGSAYADYMYQLYCNGVMVGSLENGVLSYNPGVNLNRAEAAKILVCCLFDLNEDARSIQVSEEGEKTVYIMLYDSEVGSWNDGQNTGSRYRNSTGGDYQYTPDFFQNYFDMIGNKKIGFVISIRDVDFDQDTTGYNQNNYKYLQDITDTRLNHVTAKTIDKTAAIINNMKTGLNAVNAGRADKIQMPELYIGTPHLAHVEIQEGIDISTDPNKSAEQDLLDKYMYVTRMVYNGIANQCGDGIITGLYFGREDPDSMWNSAGNPTFAYKNRSQISEFIHSKGKKLIWVPYSTTADHWSNIAQAANMGKTLNKGEDLFDVVMMQPGLFYSNYNSGMAGVQSYNTYLTAGDSQYNDQLRKVKDLYLSTANNQFYMFGQPYGKKTTNTNISFEMEYDISLVTGRIHDDYKIKPTKKADNFTITYNYYKDLIYNHNTSFAIYAGGPNEQNYEDVLSLRNNNRHCYINHPSYFGSEANGNHNDLGDNQAYSWFYNEILKEGVDAYYTADYNKLMYDMTYGLLYGEAAFTEHCKDYLGWH